MKQELTADQISTLFKFVESKNVKWKDVQCEIVDHLATSIEERMDTQGHSFERALDHVYGGFPITGFAQMIQGKQKALGQYWNKRLIRIVGSYFSPPMILAVISVSFMIWQLVSQFGGLGFNIAYALTILTVAAGWYYRKYRGDLKDENPMSQYLFSHKLLVLTGGLSFPIFATIYLHAVMQDLAAFQFAGIMIAGYFSFLIFWTHAHVFVFPDLLMKEIDERFGHLKF